MDYKKILFFIILLNILVGCDEKKDKLDPVNLPSKRIDIFHDGDNIKNDENWEYKFSVPENNNSWLSSDNSSIIYYPENILLGNIVKSKIINLYMKNSNLNRNVPAPLIKNNMIFVKSENSEIYSYNLLNHKLVWSKKYIEDNYVNNLIGGGLFMQDNIIYASFGDNNILAINADNGEEKWRVKLSSIVRSNPIFYNNKIFVRSLDNKLYILNSEDGSLLHTSDRATENIVRSSKSAVVIYKDKYLIIPDSSGIISLVDSENGENIWSVDASFQKNFAHSVITSDMSATPIISNDKLYVATGTGNLLAIDIKTGELIWSETLNNIENIWVYKDSLFAIDSSYKLWHMNSVTGRLRWSSDLTKIPSILHKKDPEFFGPILANNSLFISSSVGKLFKISVKNGKLENEYKIASGRSSSPIIVDNKIFIISELGKLTILSSD